MTRIPKGKKYYSFFSGKIFCKWRSTLKHVHMIIEHRLSILALFSYTVAAIRYLHMWVCLCSVSTLASDNDIEGSIQTLKLRRFFENDSSIIIRHRLQAPSMNEAHIAETHGDGHRLLQRLVDCIVCAWVRLFSYEAPMKALCNLAKILYVVFLR